MNENSSQIIKELSEDEEIKNLSELDNDVPLKSRKIYHSKRAIYLQQTLPLAEQILTLTTQDLHKKNLHHFWVSMTIILSLAI